MYPRYSNYKELAEDLVLPRFHNIDLMYQPMRERQSAQRCGKADLAISQITMSMVSVDRKIYLNVIGTSYVASNYFMKKLFRFLVLILVIT